jgi:hypothetical protein
MRSRENCPRVTGQGHIFPAKALQVTLAEGPSRRSSVRSCPTTINRVTGSLDSFDQQGDRFTGFVHCLPHAGSISAT